MWGIFEGALGNFVYEFSKSSLGLKLVLLIYFVSLEIRLRFGLRFSRAAERLLKDANYAIHDLLNAPAACLAQVSTDFSAWDLRMEEQLKKLRRKRICTAWHVDHFMVLGTSTSVASPLGDSQLAGQIAAKAQRLKDIAAELDRRASLIWPL
jgi:hypothetical protein